MKLKQAVDGLAKHALLGSPPLFLGYALGVVCTPRTMDIFPALVLGAMVMVFCLVLLLIPSWLMDFIDRVKAG